MIEANGYYKAFERDAFEWYPLSHPNVVKLFGACHIGGSKFFMYGLVPNANPLHEFLSDDRNRGLTWKCLYEAALGLQYLHSRGIIHKDRRSDNILLGSDLVAKLCGLRQIRRHFEHKRDRTIWEAPEISRDDDSSPRIAASDIYAFDKCIWEALTLELPSIGFSSSQPASIGDGEWDLISKMCAFNPSERESAAYVVNRQRQFLINSEQDHPPTLDAKVGPFCHHECELGLVNGY